MWKLNVNNQTVFWSEKIRIIIYLLSNYWSSADSDLTAFLWKKLLSDWCEYD